MYDYLIKPIDLEQLSQALGGIAVEIGAVPGEAGSVDADSIVEGLRYFGDAAVVAELIDLFLQDARPGWPRPGRRWLPATPPRPAKRPTHSRAAPATFAPSNWPRRVRPLKKWGKPGHWTTSKPC